MSRAERIHRDDMEAVIEAILFVANDPVPEAKLLEVFGASVEEQAREALEAVVERYQKSIGGIMVDRAAGGLRLVSRPDLHTYLRRFFEVTGSNKLSMPALETLAIVAYRQPVTAPEISELRGVSSQGVLKGLLERRLVRVAGRKEVVGKPFLYATTRDFLMHFGLRSLDELPPLEQFEEMWAGDSEAQADAEPDLEEQAGREEAAAEQRDEDEAAKRELEEDLEQQQEAEAAELALDADEPSSEAEPATDGTPKETGDETGDESGADSGADPENDEQAEQPDEDSTEEAEELEQPDGAEEAGNGG